MSRDKSFNPFVDPWEQKEKLEEKKKASREYNNKNNHKRYSKDLKQVQG